MNRKRASADRYKNLIRKDGLVVLITDFFEHVEATSIQQKLLAELKWAEETRQIFGKPVKAPRLVCWYGDIGTAYRYSGILHQPRPWTELLKSIKHRIETLSDHRYNSVLGNLYRSGKDSMGWHADKEKELGLNPFIASLSLGANRLFKIRHNKSKETVSLQLTHGSVLLMGGSIQHHWRHSLPKISEITGPRINLTFRWVYSSRSL